MDSKEVATGAGKVRRLMLEAARRLHRFMMSGLEPVESDAVGKVIGEIVIAPATELHRVTALVYIPTEDDLPTVRDDTKTTPADVVALLDEAALIADSITEQPADVMSSFTDSSIAPIAANVRASVYAARRAVQSLVKPEEVEV